MNDEERQNWIMDYIENHPGCIMEQLINDCESVSRKTLYKIKKKLQSENKIIESKLDGLRSNPLYINKESPLVYVPAELARFEDLYSSLLVAANAKIENILASESDYKDINDIVYCCLTLLTEISNYCIYQTFLVWSKELKEPILVNKLYDIVFKKLCFVGI